MTRSKGRTTQDPTVDRLVPPNGQTVRGTGSGYHPNPKNDQARRPDVVRVTPDGDGGMVQPGMVGTSTSFPGSNAASQAQSGSSASEPSDDVVNRGYTESVDVGAKSVTVTSANRQRFGIDPGEQTLDAEGNPSVDKGPDIPKFGVGSTGS